VKRNKLNNKVAIIMGSQSDHSIMKECAKILKTLKIKYQISIVSAHRTPKRMFEFAESASKNGFGVIVAGAGVQHICLVWWHLYLPCQLLEFR